MTPSVYTVSPAEARKLQYLQRVMKAAKGMQFAFNSDKQSLAMQQGIALDRHINWQDVVRYCAPQVVVVVARDARRDSEFYEYPIYALCSETEQHLSLLSDFSLEIQDDVTNDDEVEGTLNRLENLIQGLDPPKNA